MGTEVEQQMKEEERAGATRAEDGEEGKGDRNWMGGERRGKGRGKKRWTKKERKESKTHIGNI